MEKVDYPSEVSLNLMGPIPLEVRRYSIEHALVRGECDIISDKIHARSGQFDFRFRASAQVKLPLAIGGRITYESTSLWKMSDTAIELERPIMFEEKISRGNYTRRVFFDHHGGLQIEVHHARNEETKKANISAQEVGANLIDPIVLFYLGSAVVRGGLSQGSVRILLGTHIYKAVFAADKQESERSIKLQLVAVHPTTHSLLRDLSVEIGVESGHVEKINLLVTPPLGRIKFNLVDVSPL